MKLYHGSNISVPNPKILKSDRALYFGTGFYLTSDLEQAKKWAYITTERRKTGTPTISVYKIDEQYFNHLNIKKFENIDEEWLNYVSKNRSNELFKSDFDIVIGSIANDKTLPVINLYLSGIYSIKETIERLLPQKLKRPIYV